MPDNRCCLSRLLAHHHELRVYQPKSINDNFSLDTLDRIDNHGDGTRIKCLKTLLCININT